MGVLLFSHIRVDAQKLPVRGPERTETLLRRPRAGVERSGDWTQLCVGLPWPPREPSRTVTARVDDAASDTSLKYQDQMERGGFHYTCVGRSEFKASIERLHSNGGAEGAGKARIQLPRCEGFEVRHATFLTLWPGCFAGCA